MVRDKGPVGGQPQIADKGSQMLSTCNGLRKQKTKPSI